MTGMDAWLLLIVMSLATYRLTKLVVEDTFPPVLWLRDRLVGGWRPPTMKEQHHERYPTGEVEEHTLKAIPGLGTFSLVDGEMQIYRRRWKRSPFWLAELISCPWCASGWVALGVTAGTWATVGLPMPLLVWPAVWAVGALLAAQEWA
ncbi:hypothetical protein ALMP_17350 [Streptomyces sp. A012304]|nr:hypothetical protein ALMP_17350 [Streptomyces sp. A012304]